jgi:hypothetical protein
MWEMVSFHKSRETPVLCWSLEPYILHYKERAQIYFTIFTEMPGQKVICCTLWSTIEFPWVYLHFNPLLLPYRHYVIQVDGYHSVWCMCVLFVLTLNISPDVLWWPCFIFVWIYLTMTDLYWSLEDCDLKLFIWISYLLSPGVPQQIEMVTYPFLP